MCFISFEEGRDDKPALQLQTLALLIKCRPLSQRVGVVVALSPLLGWMGSSFHSGNCLPVLCSLDVAGSCF